MKPAQRETVELVTGETYFSTDHWVTIHFISKNRQMRTLKDGPKADRVRYLAVVQHGGGRDDRPSQRRAR